jgi:hypothetical protein
MRFYVHFCFTEGDAGLLPVLQIWSSLNFSFTIGDAVLLPALVLAVQVCCKVGDAVLVPLLHLLGGRSSLYMSAVLYSR